ncbi:molybdopterin-guanine dinucleotide biosynthesis protein MobA [Desulfuromonas versatilis]|uniref:Molybdopterin-guanine dinucleotide biosynthesis protein MobA n=1 Tax=Desulfuromonas versatilis TaxID=2802975 RepID=A0ABN6E2C5_9BACT|nr:DUF2442 domain-containing protein [Desulfuromonas versatilis]BCR06481.1 molybdopterin-guanine dinucleotide biosynthesis protein MobA [Desulfuromonas versatilis]
MIKVISAIPNSPNTLLVELSDGRKGTFDVGPYLERGIFKELKNPSYFKQVKAAYGGVVWPNEQDFSPETISVELIEQR